MTLADLCVRAETHNNRLQRTVMDKVPRLRQHHAAAELRR
jgi:hypothetical protein